MAGKKERIDIKGFGNIYKDIPVSSYSSGTYRYISTAGTADMIRQDLKRMFPKYKFWVQSQVYSMGSSIDIYCWGIPEADFKEVKKLEQRYQEGSFNGMEDIYESRKMEPITDMQGNEYQYGAKYVFVNNKPPYSSKEHNLPAPDYSKISSSSSSSSSGSSKPNPKFSKKYSGSSKPNPVRDNDDYQKVAELSTGWEIFLHQYPHLENEFRIALVFNYAIGKAIYEAEKWRSLKDDLSKVDFEFPMIWSLGDKCFYLFTQDAQGNANLSVNEQRAKKFLTVQSLEMIDKVFIESGYKQVSSIYINEHLTPWGKKQDDEKQSMKEEITGLRALYNLSDDVNEQIELDDAIKTLELLYKTL